MLGSNREQVVFQGHHRAMLRPKVQSHRLVRRPIFFQFVFVNQHHVARTVIVNAGPLVPYVQVNRPVAGQVQSHRLQLPD